jgi:hypothetical protein
MSVYRQLISTFEMHPFALARASPVWMPHLTSSGNSGFAIHSSKSDHDQSVKNCSKLLEPRDIYRA